MQLSRALHVNPLVYSFLAGAVVSLSGNVYSAVSLSPPASLSGSRLQLYVAALLLGISGASFFVVAMQLDAIRAIHLSMKNPPEPNDFSMLLDNPQKSRPIKLALFVAAITAMVSLIMLGLRW